MRGQSLGYKLYMASPEWHDLRKQKLQQVGYRCQGCGSDERLQAHHLTYERFGHERLTDLMVLCHLCHAREHGLTPDVGPVAGLTVRELSKAVREREAREDRQANAMLAAYLARVLEEFSSAFEGETGAVRKRVRRIAHDWQKLIDEALDGGLMSCAAVEKFLAGVASESAA